MPSIRIIRPYESFAMKQLTEPLLSKLEASEGYVVSVSDKIIENDDVDITYHVPWHTLVQRPAGGGKHVMHYTHCNPTDRLKLQAACQNADAIVCMSFAGRTELLEMGADPKKIHVIYAGSDQYGLGRKNIGVIGFSQPNGRKREHILVDLAWRMDPMILDALQFIVIGGGMSGLVETLANAGIHVAELTGLTEDQMQSAYHQLDLLLVTGFTEGGPLPLLEAYASGLDVIAPAFGYAKDFAKPDHIYRTDDELISMLDALVRPGLENSLLAKVNTWKKYVEGHAALFGELTGDNMTILDNGADRYHQLVRIIREEHVGAIVEIGTWTGERALQMIQAAAGFRPIEEVMYFGYDLFEQQTMQDLKNEFSKESWPEEVVRRRLAATGAVIKLFKGKTKDTLPSSLPFGADLYFIDGGHSEQTIENDWRWVSDMLTSRSVVVFDDYYVGDHPAGSGCNKIVDGLDRGLYDVEFLPNTTFSIESQLQIAMVKVRYLNGALRISLQERTRTRTGAFDAGESFSGVYVVSYANAQSSSAGSGELERAAASPRTRPVSSRARLHKPKCYLSATG